MLDVTALTKTYDGFSFGPVDLSIEDEVLAVLGPSGSGKTTFLSLIAGITSPDQGSVSLNGQSLLGKPIEERRTGYVFQDGALFPHMTARENIAYAATDETNIEDLSALLEIDDVLNHRPAELSGGEQQRVALARTLAADPDALLLDEPLSSLDAPIRRRLRDELHTLFETLEIPVIYVTHDQRTATALGDRIVIFRDGRVEQVGSPSEVITRPETEFAAEFTGNENIFDATVVGHTEDGIRLQVGDVKLHANASAPNRSEVTACIPPSRVKLTWDGTPDVPEENRLTGTVQRWLNEGTEYRVILDLDDAPLTLVTTVQPPNFEQLSRESSASARVAVRPADIHVIPPECAAP